MKSFVYATMLALTAVAAVHALEVVEGKSAADFFNELDEAYAPQDGSLDGLFLIASMIDVPVVHGAVSKSPVAPVNFLSFSDFKKNKPAMVGSFESSTPFVSVAVEIRQLAVGQTEEHWNKMCGCVRRRRLAFAIITLVPKADQPGEWEIVGGDRVGPATLVPWSGAATKETCDAIGQLLSLGEVRVPSVGGMEYYVRLATEKVS